ncbi:META domain-containing protein [Oceanivirga salmonicida]|uniref:META domain-containing protein n=1 Tax=Oceanivirga salmonicida TaxID=1769291 RepID=UPI00082DE6BB|nr:META domain-containing protein [Oceanivirga salmonicida]
MQKLVKIMLFLSVVSCSNMKNNDSLKLDKEMILETIEYNNEKLDVLDKNVTIIFDNEKVAGKSFVNNYFGDYTLTDGKIKFGEIATTLMAGPEKEMQLEQLYLKLLEESNSYSYKGEKLFITNDNNKLIFISNIELDGKKFKLDENVYIEFKDGNVSGKSGVNTFFGKYTLSGNKFMAENLATTLIAGEEKLMESEKEFIAMLSSENKIKLENGKLILENNGKKLEFTEVK